jgi:hypothetical protein
MARIRKEKNDKFYTKEHVAIKLLGLLDLSEYNCIIEPSAGNGSFSKNISHDNLISLDIEPEDSSITKMNWFDFQFDKVGKTLVVGNPPFGNQGSLALNFIKKCNDLAVDTIAFILPKSFKKDTYKNKIPEFYHLDYELDLEDDSYLLIDKSYSVPSVFQIWVRKSEPREKAILKTNSDLIKFVKKTEDPDYSFRRVGFYAGSIYDQINEKSEQSHYFIKSSDEIKDFLKDYRWVHNNTAGPRSIGKSEIVRIVEEYEKNRTL